MIDLRVVDGPHHHRLLAVKRDAINRVAQHARNPNRAVRPDGEIIVRGARKCVRQHFRRLARGASVRGDADAAQEGFVRVAEIEIRAQRMEAVECRDGVSRVLGEERVGNRPVHGAGEGVEPPYDAEGRVGDEQMLRRVGERRHAIEEAARGDRERSDDARRTASGGEGEEKDGVGAELALEAIPGQITGDDGDGVRVELRDAEHAGALWDALHEHGGGAWGGRVEKIDGGFGEEGEEQGAVVKNEEVLDAGSVGELIEFLHGGLGLGIDGSSDSEGMDDGEEKKGEEKGEKAKGGHFATR